MPETEAPQTAPGSRKLSQDRRRCPSGRGERGRPAHRRWSARPRDLSVVSGRNGAGVLASPGFGPLFGLALLRQRISHGSRERSLSVDVLRIVAAILLPPLGVFLQVGIGKHFWINVLLTILGYIPGIIHAVWVIAKY